MSAQGEAVPAWQGALSLAPVSFTHRRKRGLETPQTATSIKAQAVVAGGNGLQEGSGGDKGPEGGGSSWWWVCPECHVNIKYGTRFCMSCGKEILWK